MNTRGGAKKARRTLISKFGSEEAYLAYMRDIASRGRIAPENTTFYKNRDIASKAGKKGKRGKKDIESQS